MGTFARLLIENLNIERDSALWNRDSIGPSESVFEIGPCCYLHLSTFSFAVYYVFVCLSVLKIYK